MLKANPHKIKQISHSFNMEEYHDSLTVLCECSDSQVFCPHKGRWCM